MSFIDTPYIDYNSHPGFLNLITKQERNIDLISMELASKIQFELKVLDGLLKTKTIKEIKNIYLSKIVPLLNDLKEQISACEEVSDGNKIICNKILSYTEHFILDDIQIQFNKNKNRNESLSNLQKKGIQKFKFTAKQLKDFNLNQLADQVNALKEKSKDLTSINDFVLHCNSKIFSRIEKFVKKRKILKLASDYLNTRCKVNYIVLIYNSDKEKWWKDAYKDVGLPDSEYTYYHYDFTSTNIKLIIYLSDVTNAKGPFKSINNSYYDGLQSFQHYLFKCVDRIMDDEIILKNNINTTYYRKKLIPEQRLAWLDLPKGLRGTSHFGDDILEKSQLAYTFKKNEDVIVSEDFNAFIFDGSHLIHRGGQVIEGERYALQIGISPKDHWVKEFLRSSKRFMMRLKN